MKVCLETIELLAVEVGEPIVDVAVEKIVVWLVVLAVV